MVAVIGALILALVYLLPGEPSAPPSGTATPPEEDGPAAATATSAGATGASETFVTEGELPAGLFGSAPLSGELGGLAASVAERRADLGLTASPTWVRQAGDWAVAGTAALLVPVDAPGIDPRVLHSLDRTELGGDALLITLDAPDLGKAITKADHALRNVAESQGQNMDGARIYRLEQTASGWTVRAFLDVGDPD